MIDTQAKLERLEGTGFEAEARATSQRVRRAVADALGSVQADPTRPQSVGHLLGLDKSLAWKVARVVSDEDALAAVARIPGRGGQRILIEALRTTGATVAVLKELGAALEEFEGLIERHAGDRETFGMMIAALTPEGRRQLDEGHRRLSFQGNSATWGVQARVQISAHVVVPSRQNPDLLDLAIVSGLLDLRRLRNDTPWAVASLRGFHDDGSTVNSSPAEGIDPTWKPSQGPPLMPQFCSPNLPPLQLVSREDGVTRFEIGAGAVGNTAGVTCITGWILRSDVERWRSGLDELGEHFVSLVTPAELLVHDVFLHRDLWPQLPPTAHCYSLLPGGPVYPRGGRTRGLLPLVDPLLNLGSPPDATLPEAPRYHQIIAAVFKRIGFEPTEFRGVRFRLRYPPIPALVTMRYPLPERPR
ncbi:MAG: hypothetical protein ACREJO_03840 [Phycisphaerales bacterium]